MKRRIIRIMCFILSIALSSSHIRVNATGTDNCGDNMVDIVVEMTDNRCIIASVPSEYAAEYQERLDSDPNFRQSQIDAYEALTTNTQHNSRSAYPDGPIEYQQDFDENDIKTLINSIAGPSTYQAQKAACNGIFRVADLLSLIQDCNFASAMEFGATLLAITVSASAAQNEAWWRQAEVDICNGVIRAVRYTIVQNVQSEYPKVWRVFERLT